MPLLRSVERLLQKAKKSEVRVNGPWAADPGLEWILRWVPTVDLAYKAALTRLPWARYKY